MATKNIKVEKRFTSSSKFNNTYGTTEFLINGIVVCTMKKSREFFCTIKNGTRSNIRDKVKTAYYISWNISGLKEISGGKKPIFYNIFKFNTEYDFKDSYPDLTWGDTGHSISAKKVKEDILKFLNR